VAKIPDIHDFHGRRAQWNRYYCGEYARLNYPQFLSQVIHKGRLIEQPLLPEIITGIYYAIKEKPFYHPVIIAEPPFQFDQNEKRKIKQIFMDIFRVPSLSFINSAALILFSLGKESGTVVSFGHQLGFISLVDNGKQIRYHLFELETTLQQVLHKVKELVDEFQSTPLYNKLCNITYSGGKTLLSNEFSLDFNKELASIFQEVPYVFITNPAPRDDVVIGGCCLGMLGRFQQIVEKETFITDDSVRFFTPPKDSSDKRDGLTFYNKTTAWYWFNNFE